MPIRPKKSIILNNVEFFYSVSRNFWKNLSKNTSENSFYTKSARSFTFKSSSQNTLLLQSFAQLGILVKNTRSAV
jgi:hypothetical protein